jgi:hypothetical protein
LTDDAGPRAVTNSQARSVAKVFAAARSFDGIVATVRQATVTTQRVAVVALFADVEDGVTASSGSDAWNE